MYRKITVLVFLLLSLKALAYNSEQVLIKPSSYNRYLKPQLENIFNDYYKLSSLFIAKGNFPPVIFSKMVKVRKYQQLLKSECFNKKTKSCRESLSLIIKNLKLIKKNLIKPLKTNLMSLNSGLALMKNQLIQQIDKFIYENHLDIDDSALSFFPISNKLNKLVLKVDHYMLQSYHKRIRNHFALLHREFYTPLLREISIKNNSKFIKMRLNELNAAWNRFNVVMTKRNIKLPQGAETRLEIIHKRWRSILKLLLKQ